MQSKELKNAKVAVFLNRSALCLLLLPVACLCLALNAYSIQNAFLLSFVLATYSWSFAGVLYIVSAAFHVRTRDQRPEHDAGLREAHGH